jgi:hypothetical protein
MAGQGLTDGRWFVGLVHTYGPLAGIISRSKPLSGLLAGASWRPYGSCLLRHCPNPLCQTRTGNLCNEKRLVDKRS